MTASHYQLQWESVLSFANPDDYALLKIWKHPASITDWTPISVALKDDTVESDVMGLHSIMVWSRDVLDAFAPLINDCIQALPISLNNGEYFAIHITSALDCLDADKSQFRRFKNRNIGVEQYVLRGDCISDTPLFTVPDDGYSAVFVSSDAKTVVDEAGWLGLTFSDIEVS